MFYKNNLDYEIYRYSILKPDKSKSYADMDDYLTVFESIIKHRNGTNFVLNHSLQAIKKYKNENNKILTYRQLSNKLSYWLKKHQWLKDLHKNPLNATLWASINIAKNNIKQETDIPQYDTSYSRDVRFYEHISLQDNRLKLPIFDSSLDVRPLEPDAPISINNKTIRSVGIEIKSEYDCEFVANVCVDREKIKLK